MCLEVSREFYHSNYLIKGFKHYYGHCFCFVYFSALSNEWTALLRLRQITGLCFH